MLCGGIAEINEENGIDISFLLPIVSPEMYYPQTNEDIIEIAQQYPDRFVPFCNIDPRAMRNSLTSLVEVPLIGTLGRWLKEGKISKANYNKITQENAMRTFEL